MLANRLGAMRAVKASLIASENAVDTALAASSRLSADMVNGRMSAGVSALFGQEALEEVVHANLALADARRRLVEAHKKLTVVRHEMGLDAFAAGDGVPKPPMPIFEEGSNNNEPVAA